MSSSQIDFYIRKLFILRVSSLYVPPSPMTGSVSKDSPGCDVTTAAWSKPVNKKDGALSLVVNTLKAKSNTTVLFFLLGTYLLF
jgi:hypothetical protein